jgi:DNA repair protein RadC
VTAGARSAWHSPATRKTRSPYSWTPSKEDIEITRRLREVGDIIGVRVLDHIIIGKGYYVSLVDEGYW